MASFFSRRLSCFYCGQRSAQEKPGPVRKWRCKHCEAINYLDEDGNITDPPATETNPAANDPGTPSRPFDTVDLKDTGLFCSTCLRNQNLFMSALASWVPSSDDQANALYEREYPKFRRHLEEQYPQVCAKCEPRVQQRIAQTGYEAKADNLRRMMERSKESRVARQARNRNWRSLLVSAGAIGHWGSISGQLAWDLISAMETAQPIQNGSDHGLLPYTLSYVRQLLPNHASVDLASYAGLSLVAGILSIWWNPKLRLRVEGIGGRFVGLTEYYEVQLIVIVVRCVFWAVLKDPSSSGLPSTMLPGLHMFMVMFTILSALLSSRVIQHDTRPLVDWSKLASETTTTTAQTMKASATQQSASDSPYMRSIESTPRYTGRFPIEKLATPRPEPEPEPTLPSTPRSPEVDSMDWTPSQQHDFRPTVSVYQRNQKSVLDGPLPFYGSLPSAPKPPSWAILDQGAQKPIKQVVERNPFHHRPAQPTSWQRKPEQPETVFAPPKFFPRSDYTESTGLEALFDRAFTIKSPEEDGEENWQFISHPSSYRSTVTRNSFLFQSLRVGLLLSSILAWVLSQMDAISIPGNYIEVASLGSASLISGFSLLECLKWPVPQWNSFVILVYIAELVAAVHLGANLPRVSFDRAYFDRYGKFLLTFMAIQETMSLLACYRATSTTSPALEMQGTQPTHPEPTSTESPLISSATEMPSSQPRSQVFSSQSPPDSPASSSSHITTGFSNRKRVNQPSSLFNSQSSVAPSSFSSSIVGSGFPLQLSDKPLGQGSQAFCSQSSVPPLSFSSTIPSSSFSSQPSEIPNQFGPSSYNTCAGAQGSFTLNDLKGYDSDDSGLFGHDSDTETTATTATATTNNTIRNIRYGRNIDNDAFFSPARSGLGPGITSLSLEDQPFRRVTRSQTKRQRDMFNRYPLRGIN